MYEFKLFINSEIVIISNVIKKKLLGVAESETTLIFHFFFTPGHSSFSMIY